MKLVFLGPPGVGKGTQATRVAQRYSLEHISTGELLRAEIAAATPLGCRIESLINHGQLVDDELMLSMLSAHLKSLSGSAGYILDGFPRTLPQAREFSHIDDIDAAVCFDAPDDAIVSRIGARRVCSICRATYATGELAKAACPKCGGACVLRDDDKPDVVLKRLEVYKSQTMPIIDYYDSLGKLLFVDATGSVKEVFETATAQLDKLKSGGNDDNH